MTPRRERQHHENEKHEVLRLLHRSSARLMQMARDTPPDQGTLEHRQWIAWLDWHEKLVKRAVKLGVFPELALVHGSEKAEEYGVI